MIIKKVIAKETENSRREKTIRIILKTDQGKYESFAPSGASTGKYEVMAFPQGGVRHSIDFINKTLNEKLKGYELKSFDDFVVFEEFLHKFDPTPNWTGMGGNSVVALEFAALKAMSRGYVWRLLNPNANTVPRPLGNVIGGGKHIKKPGCDFQEFLLFSTDAKSFSKAVKANRAVYDLVYSHLKKRDIKFRGEVTDEGAWAPDLTNLEILDVLRIVIRDVGMAMELTIRVGLDVAASSFFDGKSYIYKNFSRDNKQKVLSRDEQINYITNLIKTYNLSYVEDPLEQEDFDGFARLRKLNPNTFICGDDLIATNPQRLKIAIKKKSINTVIVKPNQIGSIVKTKEVIDLAKKNDIYPVVSHRSGETKDSTISHLAVGFGVPLIKCGIVGKEREAKLQEIKRIEEQIRG